jgi:hypothetical protein
MGNAFLNAYEKEIEHCEEQSPFNSLKSEPVVKAGAK